MLWDYITLQVDKVQALVDISHYESWLRLPQYELLAKAESVETQDMKARSVNSFNPGACDGYEKPSMYDCTKMLITN